MTLVKSSHLKKPSNVLLQSSAWGKLQWRICPATQRWKNLTLPPCAGRWLKHFANVESPMIGKNKRWKSFCIWKTNYWIECRTGSQSLTDLNHLHLKSLRSQNFLPITIWTYYAVSALPWKLFLSPVCQSATPSTVELTAEPSGSSVLIAERMHIPYLLLKHPNIARNIHLLA